jgi:hypothetical protein
MSAAGAVSAALLYLVCQTSVEVMGLEPRSRRRPNSLADAVDAHNDTELRTSSHAISGVLCREHEHRCADRGAPGGANLPTFCMSVLARSGLAFT